MLDDRRAEDFEKEILVGLTVPPRFGGGVFDFRTGADRDDHGGVNKSVGECLMKMPAVKRDAVQHDRIACDTYRFTAASVDPRLTVRGIPCPRLLGALEREPLQHV